MLLKCKKCGYEWDYQQKSKGRKVRATCPRCFRSVYTPFYYELKKKLGEL